MAVLLYTAYMRPGMALAALLDAIGALRMPEWLGGSLQIISADGAVE